MNNVVLPEAIRIMVDVPLEDEVEKSQQNIRELLRCVIEFSRKYNAVGTVSFESIIRLGELYYFVFTGQTVPILADVLRVQNYSVSPCNLADDFRTLIQVSEVPMTKKVWNKAFIDKELYTLYHEE